MIVAGVGFRRGVEADEIVALVRRALHELSLTADRLAGLATAETRAAEPGLIEASRRFGVPVSAVSASALAATAPKVQTVSERVRTLYGVGSMAEAAALAGAGEAAVLLAPRIASARATCAIARGRMP